ncbi:MAG: Crp/Fnr family transcriptional regulator [Comamonadaceae bacterium]|nr:Crp/Fnr family transcriptional regulator [Comamonadaceae bacterium]
MPLTERCAVLTDNEGWFGSAAPEFQQAVLSRCEWREVMAGQPIYSASDVQTGPHAASSTGPSRSTRGTVRATTRCCTSGTRARGSATVPPIRGQPLRVTTVARTNVLLACVPWRAMQELLRERPEWWQFIARAALEYGDIAISGYADSLIQDSARRCACTLLRVAGLQFPRRSRPERPSIPITQDELATMVNVSRTTLLQILRRFEERGLVEQAYRALRVVDAAGLKEIAEGRER